MAPLTGSSNEDLDRRTAAALEEARWVAAFETTLNGLEAGPRRGAR